MGELARSWRSLVGTVPGALVLVVLAGQAVAAVDGGLRPYILGLSVLILDAVGVVASVRAALAASGTPGRPPGRCTSA